MKLPHLLTALASAAIVSSAVAQAHKFTPDHVDIAYNDGDPAQVLDVYLTKKVKGPARVLVYIHGGGWRAGTKTSLPPLIGKVIKNGWATVISVEYRFSKVAPHPAQAHDCVRAIQFIRSKAKEWNLNPDRMAVTGGSAGAHLSLWVALHDDAADPKSTDPVERQSSRVTCAISFAGPTDFGLLAEIDHKHPAYRELLGYKPGTPAAELDKEMIVDVSPITFASQDDPPILLFHGDADTVVPLAHAEKLNAKFDSIGGDCELVIVPKGTHNVARGNGEGVNARAEAFLKKHLLPK